MTHTVGLYDSEGIRLWEGVWESAECRRFLDRHRGELLEVGRVVNGSFEHQPLLVPEQPIERTGVRRSGLGW